MTKDLQSFLKEIKNAANPQKAEILQRFFKTGKGHYGEGDKFLGIMVPIQRKIAKKFPQLSLGDLQYLLNSKIHEHRLSALFILVAQFKKADEVTRKRICDFYLKNYHNINNWDLVDLSAPNIVGEYLKDKNRKVLFTMARSNSLWQKRIAILSTFTFLRQNDFKDTVKISEILLRDSHDLIHKAVGWMLREAGKRDVEVLKSFLDKHATQMPRTMLRYSIEKLPDKLKKYYLLKK